MGGPSIRGGRRQGGAGQVLSPVFLEAARSSVRPGSCLHQRSNGMDRESRPRPVQHEHKAKTTNKPTDAAEKDQRFAHHRARSRVGTPRSPRPRWESSSSRSRRAPSSTIGFSMCRPYASPAACHEGCQPIPASSVVRFAKPAHRRRRPAARSRSGRSRVVGALAESRLLIALEQRGVLRLVDIVIALSC